MRSVVWIGFIIGGIVCLGSSSSAQFRPRFSIPADNRVTAEIDRSLQQAIEDAQGFLEQNQFAPAVIRLQSVLDHPEDYFLEKDFRFRKPVAIREQALQMLADLPAQGQAAYELQVGSTARELLKEAQATNDVEKLYEIASNYQMTAAGFEALQLLAAMAFDHDHLIEAGNLCDTMLRHPKSKGPLKSTLLLKSALAWYLAGDSDRTLRALIALDEVRRMGDVAWQVGGRAITPFGELKDAPEWMAANFGPVPRSIVATVDEWETPRGGLTGNESAHPSLPIGGALWAISTRQYLRFHSDDVTNQQRIAGFDQLTNQLERLMRENNRLAQPAAIPVIVGDVVAYRTLNDVTAVSLKTGRLLWRSATTDGMLGWLFQSPLASSEAMVASSPVTFRGYLRRKLFRDQLSGSLTSDGQNLYAIEETESQFNAYLPRSRLTFGVQMVADPVNKLVAYDLKGGRLLWEIGGQNGTPPLEFAGLFFAGPPLPFGGRLYCLAESKNEMRLLCLTTQERTARLEWSQALITTDRVMFDAPFRSAGLVPAMSEGLMICPTANGSVVAFDVVQRQLKWGYSYDSQFRRSLQGGEILGDEEEGRWLDSGPVLSEGRVVLTPRDSNEIHCLNLVDGSLVWKRQRQQGLYVACVNGDQVIVVGRTQVVAFSLADGSEVWNQPTEIPEPSGRGVRIGSEYLLPLSTGHIATFDLKTGKILGRSRLHQNCMPGNLAVGEGALVSCGLNDVIGFRSLPDIERQVDRQLGADSTNAEALALRAEMRLHQGKEDDAINDLRRSLQQQPKLRVKRILVETLLDRFRNDPRQLLKSSAELQSLAEDPRQQIEVTQLLASALNETGDHVGAVTQLFRLALSTQFPEDMVASGPAHFVSLEQTIRSQLFAIYDAASSNERTEITNVFGRELNSLLASPDRDRLLINYMKFTVGHPGADRLLLRLAESNEALPGEMRRTKLFERIAQSENKPVAAAAVAALASRFLASNSPVEARPWIKELGRRFPSEVVRDGKTGRQLSDEWMGRTEIRRLDVGKRNWPQSQVDVNRTENNLTQASWPVDVVTHAGHYFEGWTFETDALVTTLTARDQNFKVAWRFPLMNSSNDLRVHPSQLHIRGRRLAFSSGTWLGVMEVADSQSEPRLLFEKSLRPNAFVVNRANNNPVERRLLPNGRRFQVMFDIRGSAGFLIGLADDAVFYQLDNRLYAADPETGRILWSRFGSQFAKADATADKSLVVNASDNGAYLLRAMDGTIQQQLPGNPNETPIWFRGTRRLSMRNLGSDQRVFELRDFDGDRVIWQSQHQATSFPSVIDDEDLAILEPSGKLTVLKLSTGEVRLAAELPLKRPLRGVVVMAAQRWEDRYVIVAGVQTKNTEQRRVIPLNFGTPKDFQSPRDLGAPSNVAFTIDGVVCSIDKKDGKVLWSVPVTDLAFDTAQPSSVPVLVLASWFVEIDARNGFPSSPKLSSLILDKWTGAKIYEKQEILTPGGRGVQFVPSIDNRKLVVDFYHFQLELTFPQAK